MYGEENIISAVIHVDRDAHLIVILCRLTKRGNLSAKDVIGDKENAQDAEIS